MMRSSKFVLTVSLLALLLLTISSYAAPAMPACPNYDPAIHAVCGKFLTYWQQHGGEAQLGKPTSEVFAEASETDGKTYLTQYFTRAVLEYHPQNKAPYEVQARLIGAIYYRSAYPEGAPGQVPNHSYNSVYYRQTGHRLGGIFHQYWLAHGGLQQFGYPISDEFDEVDTDYEGIGYGGNTYRVQYFERAAFQYHPENPPSNQILLLPIGLMYEDMKYIGDRSTIMVPAPTETPTHTTGECTLPLKAGTWLGSLNSQLSLYGGFVGNAILTATLRLEVACDGSFTGIETFSGLAAQVNHGSRALSCTLDGQPSLAFSGAVSKAGKDLVLAIAYGSGAVTFDCSTPAGGISLSSYDARLTPLSTEVHQDSPDEVSGKQWIDDGVMRTILEQMKLSFGYSSNYNMKLNWRLAHQ